MRTIVFTLSAILMTAANAEAAPASVTVSIGPELQAKADAIVKQLAAKPAAKTSVMAAASKPDAADTKTAPNAKLVVKAPEAKPEIKQPVKVADAKPAPAKPAAKSAKDTIPGLRLSANTY